MSEFIYRPGVNRLLLTNTVLQKQNDEWIQNLLNHYKYCEEKKEFDENTGDDVDLIISHKPIIPDLVIYNKTFNKNNCFVEGNIKERNNFPRKQFYIRFTDKDKEEFKKFNANRKKEKEKKIENNYSSSDLKKDNNNYNNNTDNNLKKIESINEEIQKNEKKNEEINENIDKNGDNNNEEKEKEKTEKVEEENDSDSEEDNNNEENEDEEKEEKENENDPNGESKNKEKKEFNINVNGIQNNFDDGISNLSTASKDFYEFYPKNFNKNINQKNNNMNNNSNINNNITNIISNMNNNNMNNNLNIINPNFDFNQFNNIDNISLSEEISQKGDISFDASMLNQVNNLIDSQIGNESFINKNNPNQFNNLLNTNNLNNLNNFGFPNNNMNNNDLQLKLLLMQQQNNNNQFNQNNNLYNLFGGNQNYMNNLNILNTNGNNGFSFNPLQNNYNLNIQDNILKLVLDCMENKGWTVFTQDGNFVNEYNSLELFQYLTETIVGNIKLDNLYISNKNKSLKERIKGGIMYMKLLEILPIAYQIMENQCRKEIELKRNILYTTNNLNNNIGAVFSNNNLNFNLNNMNNNIGLNNNNNFIMNNLNNNNTFGNKGI